MDRDNARLSKSDVAGERYGASEVMGPDGKRLDVSGSVWRVGADHTINWSQLPPLGADVVAALQAHFKHIISTFSSWSVDSRFESLKMFFQVAYEIKVDLSSAANLDASLLSKVRDVLSVQYSLATVTGTLHAYRLWYIWSADADFPGFDFEVTVQLENFTIGGGQKGEAVLRNDPKCGPLHAMEFERLYQTLRRATELELLRETDLAAAWLFMALGCNPRSLQLLNEEDLICTQMVDGTVKYELRLPRIKKPGALERSQFRTRPLRTEIGQLLGRVVAANRGQRALFQGFWRGQNFSTPLFRTSTPREYLIGTAFESEAFRYGNRYFQAALDRVSCKLNLIGRDGEPLHLTPRRLRYTFATRLVQDGASPVMLADALDHTDLQHVMVYYNARSDIVAKLDKTIAMQLAPWAQAFMGKIVRSESVADRGDDPASRVRHLDRHHGKLETIGTCASHGPCGLSAPIACYTCNRFQPWLEAPHESVLDALLDDRNLHLQRRADPKMTQARDLTITAVASVVQQCQQMLAEGKDE
ncbi:tyrosine-type recombinase/integrase [Ralstonia pseudosolanacearum]|uniref:site-specific integrase n=1 Tax=Ralstonia pseudosolanacearum TaxID=1310165 RepID=UPI0013747427|nr:site-specific integrase [Ralstonia pseudosolanacearum]MCK4120280.1 phage integrase family protein [Ralstonia pseudosolanacearum]